jgi:integrator complex subunit 11
VLLDAGAHPAYADSARRLPDFASLSPLDAVLVTHFHLDHAGALPALYELLAAAPPSLVMTAPTRSLAALMLADFHATSAARGQPPPFQHASIATCLASVTEIAQGEPEYSPPGAPDLSIAAHYAGHVFGAVMFLVTLLDHGTVVNSGDYLTTPDRHLRPSETPVFPRTLRPDVFITESTYCGTLRTGIGVGGCAGGGGDTASSQRARVEADLFTSVLRVIRAREKILIPISALGRAHELIAMLAALWADHDLAHVPVHVTAGLMAKASLVYEAHAGDWCVPRDGGSDQDDGDGTFTFPA